MNLDGIVTQLKAERDRLTAAISALEGVNRTGIHRKRRRMSAAARRRISLAQKARWARQRKKAA